MTPQQEAIVKAEFEQRMLQKKHKPFVVSIMGQTGVGKSSLLNALFNPIPPLVVGQARPTTRQVESIERTNERGHDLVFHDMPGTGESEQFDKALLSDYREYLLKSDAALWAIHGDSRSVTFDAQALKFLVDSVEPEQKSQLMSKITFVMTKADLLVETPWIMTYLGRTVTFTPAFSTGEILKEKLRYYQEKFIEPYGSFIVSRTHNNVNFVLQEPRFRYDKYNVYYEGMLTEELVAQLKRRFPQYSEIFDRLYTNYRVISCSARFKYNLIELMLAIRNKLGLDAYDSFNQAVNIDLLDQMAFDQGVKRCNLRIHDPNKQQLIFDLPRGIFPGKNDLPELYRGTGQNHKALWPLSLLKKIKR